MRINAVDFFSPDDKALIRQAIEKAESVTSGEIAVMVVDESDSYREAAALGGFFASGFLSLVLLSAGALVQNYSLIWTYGSVWTFTHMISEIADHVSIWIFIPLVFLLFFPCRYIILKFPKVKILFMSAARLGETVRERALRAFYEKGLFRTRDETGVLIFITLLERMVWILGDRGINSRIAADFWKVLADELTSGIRGKDQGGTVAKIIGKCGDELARHFPRKPDDANELSDEVMYEQKS